jgi:hypothetical protein
MGIESEQISCSNRTLPTHARCQLVDALCAASRREARDEPTFKLSLTLELKVPIFYFLKLAAKEYFQSYPESDLVKNQ